MEKKLEKIEKWLNLTFVTGKILKGKWDEDFSKPKRESVVCKENKLELRRFTEKLGEGLMKMALKVLE